MLELLSVSQHILVFLANWRWRVSKILKIYSDAFEIYVSDQIKMSGCASLTACHLSGSAELVANFYLIGRKWQKNYGMKQT